jgi:hypothetical protein
MRYQSSAAIHKSMNYSKDCDPILGVMQFDWFENYAHFAELFAGKAIS